MYGTNEALQSSRWRCAHPRRRFLLSPPPRRIVIESISRQVSRRSEAPHCRRSLSPEGIWKAASTHYQSRTAWDGIRRPSRLHAWQKERAVRNPCDACGRVRLRRSYASPSPRLSPRARRGRHGRATAQVASRLRTQGFFFLSSQRLDRKRVALDQHRMVFARRRRNGAHGLLYRHIAHLTRREDSAPGRGHLVAASNHHARFERGPVAARECLGHPPAPRVPAESSGSMRTFRDRSLANRPDKVRGRVEQRERDTSFGGRNPDHRNAAASIRTKRTRRA